MLLGPTPTTCHTPLLKVSFTHVPYPLLIYTRFSQVFVRDKRSMEVGMMMEVEDDVFFADLNRQISLLITDDEDDDRHDYYCRPPIPSYPTAVSIQLQQAFSRASRQPQYQFDQSSYKPILTDQSKGTGVFIPMLSQLNRRRSKHHQTKTSNNRSYKLQQQLPSRPAFAQVVTPNNC